MSPLFKSPKFSSSPQPHNLSSNQQNWLAQIPLRFLLTVPFVIQLLGAVGLVGYFSYRSGQQSVENLAEQLINQTSFRIQGRLDDLVQTSHTLIRLNDIEVASGDLALNDFAKLEHHFWHQLKTFESVQSIGFANAAGELVVVGQDVTGVTTANGEMISSEVRQPVPGTRRYYRLDEAGQRGALLNATDDYDPRLRPWYQAAVSAGQPTWSPVFSWRGLELAGITAVAPVYRDGELQGVWLSDWMLSTLNYYLDQIQPTSSIQTFVIERSGALVATSTQEQPFMQASDDQLDGQRLVRLKAVDSRNLLTRATAQAMLKRWQNLQLIQSPRRFNFRLDRERQFVQVMPYRDRTGLDWLVVTVVPESDFMAEIKTNQRRTLLLCGLTVLLALGTGLLTADWITRPIRRLRQASVAIARGQFDTLIPVGGVGEVAQLSEQFRRMAHQLSIFFETAQASEQKFATLLAQLPVGVSVFDAAGQLIYVNQVGQQMAGQNPESVSLSFGRAAETYPAYIAGTQDPYPIEQLPLKRALRGEATIVDDLDVEIGGRRIPLEVQTIPVRDEQGQVVYAINVFQDITERRRAAQLQENYKRDLEQALVQQTEAILQSEARFQFAVNQIPDVFVLYDAERRFQYVNARGVELSGVSLEDHLGKRDEDLHPPEVTHTYLPLLERAIATRSVQTGECTIVLPDRDPFTIIVKYAPLLDSDGTVQQVVALTYDITERKRAELALQESEARFRQIAATISQLFLIRDAISGQFLYISPAYETIWGRSCESLYQNPESWLEAIYPEDLPLVQQSLRQQFHGQPARREYRIQRPDGSLRWIQAMISPVQDAQGRVVRYAGSAEDITERKQAELALQTTTRQLQTFLDNAPVIISRFDADGRYLQVNPAFAALLGRSEADIVGRTFADFYPQSVVDSFRTRLNQIIESGLPLNVDDELVLDGEVKTFQTIVFPVMTEQGTPSSFWAISTDISDRKRAELALQHSETRLKLITDSLPGCIAYIDASQRYQFVNRTYEHWFHCRKADMIGHTVQEIIGTAAYQVVQLYIERVLSGETVAYQHDMPYQRGKKRYVSAVLVPDIDQHEMVHGYYALITDISDRRQAELALQETNVRQRAILSVMPDLMYVVAIDGRVLGQVTFRPERDLFAVDQPIAQATIFDVGTPENISRKVSALKMALATRSVQIYEQQVEKDGKTWYEEVRCVPMPDDRALFMFRDISDRKQAERVLQESEERFRRAFDNAPIGMALVAPRTGRFLRVNRELQQILGYSEAELLQFSFEDITHTDDLKADLEGQQQLITGQIRQYQTQKRYLHKQGQVVHVLLSSSMVCDQFDNPLHFVTHVLDISERYRIDRMKDEFVSIVSHELRTPLTAIRGSLGILETGVLNDDPEQMKALLKIASNNSERLVRLVNDILDLERLESGKTDLVMQVCTVSAVIQDAVEAVTAIADAAGVTLSVSQIETHLYAAPDAIVQTLTNLLSNAIKFSDPGSTVWITAEPLVESVVNPDVDPTPEPSAGTSVHRDITYWPATYWQFSVRDQGRGIPADKQEMIFERFQQIDVSDARQKGGTGLGLAICQSIIRQHQGRIWVESELGQGSVFYFTVPCWRKET